MDAPPATFEGDFFGLYNPVAYDHGAHDDHGLEEYPNSRPTTPFSTSSVDTDDDLHDLNNTLDDYDEPPKALHPAVLHDINSVDVDLDESHIPEPERHTPSELPRVLEPAAPTHPPYSLSPPTEDSAFSRATWTSSAIHQQPEEGLRTTKTVITPYPNVHAGAALDTLDDRTTYGGYQAGIEARLGSKNPYAPFASKMEWEIARWAKLRHKGSTAFTELIQIDDLKEHLGLSFSSSRELNMIIDQKLGARRPPFERHEVIVAGEAFEVYYRDVLGCIKALFGDPEFAPFLLTTPERHFTDDDQTARVYFDMNTGDWWWTVQEALDRQQEGSTVIPVIISSDKTQLTMIGNKSAYPVYMTIGNLPKDIRCKPSRRGQILLAYLPTSKLEHIANKAARRRTLANLYHACLSRVLAPLETAGYEGLAVASGDGLVRRGHPIFAVHVGDYPEQLLVTGCKNGECPKCQIPRTELGRDSDTDRPLRSLQKVLDALATLDEGPREYAKMCQEAGIKPLFHPFWERLPFTNIFEAITPDLLHQLYQGVVKHLISWIQDAFGPAEIDARCASLPPNHSLRHFTNGISRLSRVTGGEHQDMCRILLGLVIGLPLHNGASPVRLVRATRALLDFLYLAQYPAHTTDTLKLLDGALQAFHANKSIFVDLGIREHFKLPKLHFLDHYRHCIELYGTTDNYDTQFSERLHIDFTKEAYRATNHKDEFSQMTTWLERREKMQQHEAYIAWQLRTGSVLTAAHDASSTSERPTVTQLPASGQPPVQSNFSPSALHTPGLPLLSAHPQPSHDPPSTTTNTLDHPIIAGALTAPQAPLNSQGGRPRLYPKGTTPPARRPRLQMTRHPSAKAIPFDDIAAKYGARYFRDALARFVVEHNDLSSTLTRAEIEHKSAGVYFPFRKVPVFHRIKLWIDDPKGLLLLAQVADTVHVQPARKNKYDNGVAARFDTVLINTGTGGPTGTSGYRVAQARVVFKIPDGAMSVLFPNRAVARPDHLAYVEWFTPFPSTPHPDHKLYKISRSLTRHGDRIASIVPIQNITRSCHLFPDFSSTAAPRTWTSSTVLEDCTSFFVNSFADRNTYKLIY
ncbi:hypothetical protein BC628DRAFT_1491058 [Trametes gibbosa]|nr:hypothetical protein BC628DRAFT_1491058 [Trametes gibbosa]